MDLDEIPLELQDEFLRDGIKFWEYYSHIKKAIYNAGGKKGFEDKNEILRDNGLTSYITSLKLLLNKYPNSDELKMQYKGLEQNAEGHGFAISDKGLFINELK